MAKKIFSIFALCGMSLMIFTQPAHANIGLPMIFLGLPFLTLAFIPVVIIEMIVYHKHLNISWKRARFGSSRANILTTIVGYPISWLLHVGVGLGIGYPLGYLLQKFFQVDWLGYALYPLISAWLMPGVELWLLYLAGIFGLIPAFWISGIIEGKFLQKLFKECDAREVKKAVWKANSASYLVLAGFLGVMSLYHGLIKLNAFDFLRDRSDEKVAFSTEAAGRIFVSSVSEVYSLDLSEHKTKKILIGNLAEIKHGILQNVAIGQNQIWFTMNKLENDRRKEQLYCYDLVQNRLKAVTTFNNVMKIESVKDSAFVFSGVPYFSHKEEEMAGVFKVSSEGDVQKVFNAGRWGSDAVGAVSPSGEKLAEIRKVNSTSLNIIQKTPVVVRAELRVYNLNTKEITKVADLWAVSLYPSVDHFHLSWHPQEDILYFSNTEYPGNVDGFLGSLDINDLKKRFGTGDINDAYHKQIPALMEAFNVSLKTGIYEYGLQTGQVGKFTEGTDLLGWSPTGRSVVVDRGNKRLEVFNLMTGEMQGLLFNHAKKDRGQRVGFFINTQLPQLSWSMDEKFIAYLGSSEHFLDQHYYSSGVYGGTPGWVWIKELATGKERKFDVKPINSAEGILWR